MAHLSFTISTTTPVIPIMDLSQLKSLKRPQLQQLARVSTLYIILTVRDANRRDRFAREKASRLT